MGGALRKRGCALRERCATRAPRRRPASAARARCLPVLPPAAHHCISYRGLVCARRKSGVARCMRHIVLLGRRRTRHIVLLGANKANRAALWRRFAAEHIIKKARMLPSSPWPTPARPCQDPKWPPTPRRLPPTNWRPPKAEAPTTRPLGTGPPRGGGQVRRVLSRAATGPHARVTPGRLWRGRALPRCSRAST